MNDSRPSPPSPVAAAERFLVPGQNCWRIERAHRLAVIVDAADYFAAVKSSILQAKRRVLLIGWDFDVRIKLDPDQRKTTGPDKLGQFLNWVVAERPELEIFVLKWDLGMVAAFGRGTTPLFILDWITDKRMHFKLDGAHPVASAHHQKIVVIDDSVAFCGGIDITAERWDTREHLDEDPHRRRPTTRFKYGPWHDATTAVDGDVARALGELARQRWKRATGEDLDPPDPLGDPWPEGVRPTFENVDVAIARTIPDYEGQEEVREIQALYLSAIARAKHSIYMESQYFASRRIAEAIASRMREPEAPEIVIINPESAYGWLEEEVMSSTRARLIKMIQAVDHNRRFRMFSPMTAGGTAIYVHAKIMVVDDWLLRVGSSNLNNRSLGFDTECDLAVEAVPGAGEAEIKSSITAFRDDLLAEHLGTSPDAVAAASRAASGSLIGTIEALRTDGRTLKPFEPPEFGSLGETLAENELLDPERAASPAAPFRRWAGAIRRKLPGASA